MPKQKKTSWSESDKERKTSDSSSVTSSVSSHEYPKRKHSLRPPPGSPKKRENSPKKKIIPKEVLSKDNKMEFFDVETDCKDSSTEEYIAENYNLEEDAVNDNDPEDHPLI